MSIEDERRQLTVHVVDDDEAVRQAITMLLQAARIRVEAYASGLALLDALPSFGDTRGACIVTDVRMPGLDGLELLRRLKEGGYRGPVVVMTAHGDVSTAVQAMKAGAVDFIEKPFDDTMLLDVISTALDTSGVPETVEAAVARVAALSPREREVLDLLIMGKPNKAIARDLGLSPRTVEIHRARLMTRLEVGSLAEAVRLAMRAELGSRDERPPMQG